MVLRIGTNPKNVRSIGVNDLFNRNQNDGDFVNSIGGVASLRPKRHRREAVRWSGKPTRLPPPFSPQHSPARRRSFGVDSYYSFVLGLARLDQDVTKR
jgi:hypothetical protein